MASPTKQTSARRKNRDSRLAKRKQNKTRARERKLLKEGALIFP